MVFRLRHGITSMAKQPLTKKQKEALYMIKRSEDGHLRLGGTVDARTIKSLKGRGLIHVEDGFASLTFAGEGRVR